jgi:hypothetical protein
MTNFEKTNSFVGIYKANIIGLFFLLAFLLYGFGRIFFESEISFGSYFGAFLILANSILVIYIGVFLRKTLRQFSVFIGNIYLFSRVLEAIALASIILNLFAFINISQDFGYFLGMIFLGIGSIPMCYLLFKQKIVPNWMAIWGLIGYAVFTFGFLMELFGKPWSMYLLAPGGLWEIVFAFWLMLIGGKSK